MKPNLRSQPKWVALFLISAILPAAVVIRFQRSPAAAINGPKNEPASYADYSRFGIAVDHSILDLGECPATGSRTGEFRLTNITKQPLTIKNVRPSCGCTSVSFANTVLGPLESVTVPVSVDISSLSGSSFEKLITVDLSQPAEQHFALEIKGTIANSGYLTAIPGTVYFAVTSPNESLRRHVHLEGDSVVLSVLPKEFTLSAGGMHTIILSPPPSTGYQTWTTMDIVVQNPKAVFDETQGNTTIKLTTSTGACYAPYRFEFPAHRILLDANTLTIPRSHRVITQFFFTDERQTLMSRRSLLIGSTICFSMFVGLAIAQQSPPVGSCCKLASCSQACTRQDVLGMESWSKVDSTSAAGTCVATTANPNFNCDTDSTTQVKCGTISNYNSAADCAADKTSWYQGDNDVYTCTLQSDTCATYA